MIRVVLVLAALAAIVGTASSAGDPAGRDWPLYGYDAARHNASPETALTAANLSMLHGRRVRIDGTVDSSPI